LGAVDKGYTLTIDEQKAYKFGVPVEVLIANKIQKRIYFEVKLRVSASNVCVQLNNGTCQSVKPFDVYNSYVNMVCAVYPDMLRKQSVLNAVCNSERCSKDLHGIALGHAKLYALNYYLHDIISLYVSCDESEVA